MKKSGFPPLEDGSAPWWPTLGVRLAALHDELYAELRAGEGKKPVEQETFAFESDDETSRVRFSSADDVASVELRHRSGADNVPWSGASAEELECFRVAHHGTDLRAVMMQAFGSDGSLDAASTARAALLTLVAWDARYLWHPYARLLVRQAQVAGDRVVLKQLGHALWQNDRYEGRGKRGQALMTRMLLQLRFGDANAYQALKYRKRVRDGLIAALDAAGVPEAHDAMKLLATPAHFDKHLRRIGALPLRQRRT